MKNPGELIVTLFNARTAAHIAHLSVSGPGADAAHRALQEFYENIDDVADRFAEAYQGCEGELIKFGGSNFKLEKDPLKMIADVKAKVIAARGECQEYPFLQQILDDATEVCAKAAYRLTFLK